MVPIHSAPDTASDVQRRQWRELLISTREQLAQQPIWFQKACDTIRSRLRDILVQRQPTCVGAYAPIRGEFDPLPLLTEWLSSDPQRLAALPREGSDRALDYLRWTPGIAMQRGKNGILVPANDDIVLPDLLLVPCVGWNQSRVRLGYGGGYFDRTLAQWPAEKKPWLVGVAFRFAQLPELHAQPHDVLMDEIVTD